MKMVFTPVATIFSIFYLLFRRSLWINYSFSKEKQEVSLYTRWLFVSSVSRVSARNCLHTESTDIPRDPRDPWRQENAPHGNCWICLITLIIMSPANLSYLRVSFFSRKGAKVLYCQQIHGNTQNCDLLHSRSVRMKMFCEFCGFCVRYYFYVTQSFLCQQITGITMFFHSAWVLFHLWNHVDRKK